MTTSVWNKAEIERSFGGYKTLQEVIAHLEAEIALKGEVVCEIRVNGHALDEEDEEQIATIHCGTLESLVVYSTEPGILVKQALQSSIAFVPHVQESCVKASERFRAADMHVAHNDFSQTIEGCFWLVDTLKHIRGASSGASGVGLVNASDWGRVEVQFSGVIREVVNAYEGKDFVLVADLLEYELSEAISAWKPVLEAQVAV